MDELDPDRGRERQRRNIAFKIYRVLELSATLNTDREMQEIVFGALQQRFERWQPETRRARGLATALSRYPEAGLAQN